MPSIRKLHGKKMPKAKKQTKVVFGLITGRKRPFFKQKGKRK